jgi:pre-mRNA-splicing helicase BRR2
LTQTVGIKNLLDLLSNASEYDLLPIILGREEEERIGLLLDNQRFLCEHSRVRDPHLVANVLLQAHLSRLPVGANLALAQRYVVVIAERLLQAIIAIACEQRSSDPTLICLAIAFNQMLIQAIWEDGSMLLQVPHLPK